MPASDRTVQIVKRESQSIEQVTLDPQALITKAIEAGSGVETLERLFALAKDVQATKARSAWYAAMADFQRSCPSPKKDKTANAGSFAFKYATLDEWMSTILPVMGPLGLSVSWRKHEEAKDAVTYSCIVSHELGHSEESGPVTMPVMAGLPNDRGANAAQRVGIAHSYAMRYSLRAIIGLAPTDDEEAAPSGPQVQQPQRASAPPAAAAKPAGQVEVWTGTIKSVTEQKGTTNGKAWTLYEVEGTDGFKCGTFHKSERDFAKEAIGSEVVIEWTRTPKGNNAVVSIEPSEKREPGDEEPGD